MIDTLAGTDSLFTFKYCAKIEMNGCTFENNWLDSGAIALYISKEYLSWVAGSNCLNDNDCVSATYDLLTQPLELEFFLFLDLSFSENRSGLNEVQHALINVHSLGWVNIVFANILIEKHTVTNNSHLFLMEAAPGVETSLDREGGSWYH